MFKKIVAGVNNASTWADEAGPTQVLHAIGEIFSNLLKLFFAFTHLIGDLMEAAVMAVARQIAKIRGRMEDRREVQLKDSLDWTKKPETTPNDPKVTAYLRR